MTEIEKARRGMRSVDLNTLVEELGAEFAELHDIRKDRARRTLAGEQFSRENDDDRLADAVVDAAADVLQAVNAMLNKINADEMLFPVVIAGVAAGVDLIKETFDGEERECMEILSEIIHNEYKYKAGNHDED